MILQQSFTVEENTLYVKEKTNTWLYSQDTVRGDEKLWESKINFLNFKWWAGKTNLEYITYFGHLIDRLLNSSYIYTVIFSSQRRTKTPYM